MDIKIAPGGKALLTLLLACLPQWIGMAQEAAIPTVALDPEPRVELRVYANGNECYLEVEKGEARPLSAFASGAESVIIGEISFRGIPHGVELTPLKRTARVSIEAGSGSSAEVPKGQTLRLVADCEGHIYGLGAPAENTLPIALKFPDNGLASIGPGGNATFESFGGDFYVLSAQGPVTATSADGQEYDYANPMPPMFGGGLLETVGPKGEKIVERLSPATDLYLLGGEGKPVQIQMEGQLYDLPESGPLVLKNAKSGSISLSYNPKDFSLNFEVPTKGLYRLKVEGVDGFRVLALSGQSGGMEWLSASKSISVKNSSTAQAVGHSSQLNVQLTTRINALLPPDSKFQYAQLGSVTSFATAAAGGTVLLFNSANQELTRLDTQNHLFEGGSPRSITGTGFEQPLSNVKLNWDNENEAFLTGNQGGLSVSSTSKRKVYSASGYQLEANYTETGEIILTSLIGNFAVEPSFVKDLQLEIPQGHSVVLSLQRRNFLFTATPEPDSGSAFKATTKSGLNTSFGGQQKLTIILGSPTMGNLAGSQAAFVFLGPGSGGRPNLDPTTTRPGVPTSLNPFLPGRITPIDTSRINEPLVSVLGPTPQ